MNAFDAALRAIFRDPNLSHSATYTPAQQLPVPLRVVFNEPDQAVKGGFTSARPIAQQLTADLLVADVPIEPDAGCVLQVGTDCYIVAECTQERGGRIWRVVLGDV